MIEPPGSRVKPPVPETPVRWHLESWWELCSVRCSFERRWEFTRPEVIMSEPLSPEQEAKAQELAAGSRPDPPMPFWRWHVGLSQPPTSRPRRHRVRRATRHKASSPMLRGTPPPKVGTPLPPSTAPTAPDAPRSTLTAKTVETLGGQSPATAPTTTAEPGAPAPAPGTGVGLTAHRLSPAVERLVALCGAVADSFEKGTELLKETAGVVLSELTVQRTTEATGERIAEHVKKGRTFGGKVAWDWFRDARGRTVGYIEIDATGVRQQGPKRRTCRGSDGVRRDDREPTAGSPAGVRGPAQTERLDAGAVRQRPVPAGGNGSAITPASSAGGSGSCGSVGGVDRWRCGVEDLWENFPVWKR